MKDIVVRVIDFFYLPFRRIMPLQTFRYAACGGGNTLLDIFLYFLAYNFVLEKQVVYTPIGAISPYIAAFLMSFVISFPIGYLLNRYIVFPGSSLKGRVQLFRYFLSRGDLTTQDFEWLVFSQKDLLLMEGLKQAGLASIRAEQFKNSVLSLVIDTIFNMIKI